MVHPVSAPTVQPVIPTSARARGWFALLVAPLVVAVGCSVVAVGFGVLGWSRAAGAYDDLDRFRAGRQTTVVVSTPAQQTVWVRHHDYGGASPSTVTVTRAGEPVAARPLPGDVTYEVGSSAITAIWAFDADEAGDYVLTASDVGLSAQFLVGTEDPEARRAAGTRWVVRGAVGLALSLGAGLTLVAIGRLRARSAALDWPPPTPAL